MSNAAYYWTAFCLNGENPNKLHCTHKFLGDLPSETARKVQSTLAAHFRRTPLNPSIQLEFDQPALFGKDANIPVLIASAVSAGELKAFGDLRLELDQVRMDDFAEFKPHVTTDRAHVVGRVTSYVLMRGKRVVQQWHAGERYYNTGDVTLAPIKEHVSEFDQLEKEILRAFRKALYGPILEILGRKPRTLANARGTDRLKTAINAGAITYRFGGFVGTFSAAVSKELRELGAEWDRKREMWRISTSLLPVEIRATITASNARWERTLERIDDRFRQILPAEIAEQVDSLPLFDSSLWKVDRKIDNTLRHLSVLPKLTDERRRKIAEEWRDNLKLWVTDFAAEEIPKLRDQVAEHAFSGGRFESLVHTLQKSYGVTAKKAQFLAHQETNLLMAKFKEARYADAGIHEYRWGCVAGSANHPVRPSHLALKDKVFRFDNPPITTAPGQPVRHCNPGEDYNCRCFARPVVRGAGVKRA